jgi:hypothetical protein
MEPITISKTSGLPPELDYYALRKEGILLLQNLSGNEWTDYNIHDPGVTILEHLCYALTELGYKTNRDIREIFAQSINATDESHTFFPADEILSSRPVTINDYRKIVIDQYREHIDNAWIEPDTTAGPDGRYAVFIRLSDQDYNDKADDNWIKKDILAFLNDRRNIGEIFTNVEILDPLKLKLTASVEIENKESESRIMAEITHRIGLLFSPRTNAIPLYRLQQLDYATDTIFEGPLTENGFILDEDLLPREKIISLSAILREIGAVKGVKQVISLTVQVNNNTVSHQVQVPEGKTLLLQTDQDGLPGITLLKGGVPLPINAIKVDKQLRLLTAADRQVYKTTSELKSKFSLTTVHPAAGTPYYSIQNDFPPNYGLGKPGAGYNFDETRKAQVRQLKAFLLLFEQVIANYQAQLSSAYQLLSANVNKEKKSYFYQLITTIPRLEEVIDINTYEKQLSRIYAAHDEYSARQNAILDHLLARFGEHFPDHIYDLLNVYFSDTVIRHRLLESKAEMLRQIPYLSANRMSAPAYSNDDSALQKRLRVQLGLISNEPGNLIQRYRGFRLDSLAGKSTPTDHRHHTSSKDELISLKKHENYFPPYNYSASDKLSLPDISVERGLWQTEEFVNSGAGFANYYYRHHHHDKEEWFELYYRSPHTKEIHPIARFREFSVLLYELKKLIYFLRGLNIVSEQFIIIEHLLLAPAKSGNIPLSFYTSAISIVLPGWTARFSNAEYRSRATTIIRQNLPAHLQVNVLWLNFNTYTEFEPLYNNWRQNGDMDGSKGRLASFLYNKENNA